MAEELKDVFKRIYKKSKRISLEKVSIIYNSIKEKQTETKEPSTISEVASDTKLKKSTVRTYIKHLDEGQYIKKNRKYTPPFLKVTTKKSEVEFIYGKDKRDSQVEEGVDELLKELKNLDKESQKKLSEQMQVIKTSKEYNSKFLTSYNKIVEQLWEENSGESLVKLEIGSGANRYFIY